MKYQYYYPTLRASETVHFRIPMRAVGHLATKDKGYLRLLCGEEILEECAFSSYHLQSRPEPGRKICQACKDFRKEDVLAEYHQYKKEKVTQQDIAKLEAWTKATKNRAGNAVSD